MLDLLLLWEWPWDRPFVDGLVGRATDAGLQVEAVGPDAMDARVEALGRDASPRVVVDRASDVLPAAAGFVSRAKARGSRLVNDPDRMAAAVDKARMHLALMSVGIHVPWTILLPPDKAMTDRRIQDLARVGTPFVIKPAHGGGGEGVVLGASTVEDIAQARVDVADTVLVQEHIVPEDLDGHPAWFRVLWCLGEAWPCFWHPATAEYAALDAAQRACPWGRRLSRTVAGIAAVSRMDLFSTELALARDGRLVAVDYVNDMCDLRPASQARDGVPDAIVDAIAGRLVGSALTARRESES